MTGPREDVLGAVRDGLVRAVLPGSRDARRWDPRDSGAGTGPEALREAFVQALTALTGHVHSATSAGGAAEVVAAVAAEHGSSSFLSWDDDQLGCPGLLNELASRGLTRVTYDLSFDPARRAAEVPALGEAVVGLTGSLALIADAGAIVLSSGRGRGRLASLLPPVHIALASASRIWPSLPALFSAEPGLVGQGANLVVIAGPSRTADIEMTLTHGVHGPKHLHVVLMP